MNKEAILNAACELFLREGMQKLTMRAIAREIGIPKQELCSLFAGKWELVGQSVAARLQKEDAYFDSVCAAARNPMDALLRMSAAMYDAFDAMGWEFAEDVSYYPSAIDALHAERRALRKRQRAVFMRGVDEGYLLGEAYYGLLEKLFWQNFSVGNRDRELRCACSLPSCAVPPPRKAGRRPNWCGRRWDWATDGLAGSGLPQNPVPESPVPDPRPGILAPGIPARNEAKELAYNPVFIRFHPRRSNLRPGVVFVSGDLSGSLLVLSAGC